MMGIHELHRSWLSKYVTAIKSKEDVELYEKYATAIAMVDALEKIYRVEVFEDGLTVLSFGIEMADLDGRYKSIDELPQWMRDRLHVLSMMDYKPPTTTVKDVGRRISREVFWVVCD
jgi:hypothetical protein